MVHDLVQLGVFDLIFDRDLDWSWVKSVSFVGRHPRTCLCERHIIASRGLWDQLRLLNSFFHHDLEGSWVKVTGKNVMFLLSGATHMCDQIA